MILRFVSIVLMYTQNMRICGKEGMHNTALSAALFQEDSSLGNSLSYLLNFLVFGRRERARHVVQEALQQREPNSFSQASGLPGSWTQPTLLRNAGRR